MSERAIFFQALDLDDPAERAAYLDKACAGDAALRRRIEALLESHAKVGDFLDVPAAQQLAAPADRQAEPPRAGVPLDFLAPSQRPDSLGRLGHYEVLEVVGQGGMGIVLRAFDAKLHRVVAIKALAPQLATSGSARQRFVREARAAAAVTHDNVIAIHAVEDAGPVPYLVMQFIDGPTLQEKIDLTGPLPVKEILRIGLQVAEGLTAAHRQGLVHRDVKPANILMENGVERVKITDFGLARTVDDVSLTQSGLIAGTPAFMSPEQAAGDHVDPRTDLFSLGSVLYTLCTGHTPFRSNTAMAVLKRVCEETPRPVREVNPDIPDWLQALIARLHAKNPADRFQTAAEVAELLGRHLAHLQQPGIVPVPVRHDPGVSRQQARRKRVPLAAAVVLLLGVAVLGVSVAAYWAGWLGNEAKTPDAPTGAGQEAPQPRPPLTPEELARLPSPLDTLKREDIPEELLKMAGRGDKDRAPPELVAVFGKDRHAEGDPRNHLNTVVISPDGKTLAFGGTEQVVRLINLEGKSPQEQTWNQPPPECNVESLAFSPDGKVLACGKGNGAILLWDVATGTELRPLDSPDGPVPQIVFSPDGTLLASAGGTVVRLWKVANGQLVFTSQQPPGWVAWCVAFSPDGKTLAAGLESGEVRLWDVTTGRERARLSGHGGRVRWLGFHPDGQSLAVAGSWPGNAVHIWDLATRTRRYRLSGHGSEVLSGAWRGDGRLLITAGSTDGTVRLWDLSSEQPRSRVLPVLPPGVPWLHSVALSPEGRHLAVTNPNGTVYVLRLAKRGEVVEVPADGEK